MTLGSHLAADYRRHQLRGLDLLKVGDGHCGEPLLWLLDLQFGEELTERVLSRITATTFNRLPEAARKLSNCIAYLLARSMMDDPAADLVCNLGPDEAWHSFVHFSREYTDFCLRYAGEYLHHDPAGEAAFVNRQSDTERTISLFNLYRIPYDLDFWEDHLRFPYGADAIRGGFAPREAPRPRMPFVFEEIEAWS